MTATTVIDFTLARLLLTRLADFAELVEDAITNGNLDEADDAIVFLRHDKLVPNAPKVVAAAQSRIADRLAMKLADRQAVSSLE
jgi:ParB-like chromosome segregation protein Spo0J